MYEAVPNFGDILNKYLWQPYLGDFIGRHDGILMMGIGTLLGNSVRHKNGQVIVCGSGSGYGADFSQLHDPNWKYFFVRGPKTARVLGFDETMAITDPAILTPEIFPAGPKTGKTIFVPHWKTSLNPLWKGACLRAGVEYVDPLSDIHEIMKSISGAKLVIAEAMHAAIIADSYRVPWISVSTSRQFNAFKWQDWAASLNMMHNFQRYAPLGFSSHAENLSSGRAKIYRNEEGTQANNQSIALPPARNASGAGAVQVARKIYKSVTPKSWQGGKYLEVLSSLANKADQGVDIALRSGMYDKFFERTVNDITKSAASQGQLSEDNIFNLKKLMLQERLKDVHTYLANYTSR
jgi:hypothetical protein